MTRETTAPATIRRRRLVVGAILGAALLVVVILAATRPRPVRQRPQPRPTVVDVHAVTDARPPIQVTGWGTVQPKRSVALVPQVSGRIVTVSPDLEAGRFVDAGDVLVEIEATDYELATRQAAAEVARAEYDLATAREEARMARAEWERTRADAADDSPLVDAQPNPLVFREPQMRQAEAGLEAARAALAQADLNLARTRLTAPFDARVIEETADAGDYVMSGSVLGRLDDVGVAQIIVNLPDRDLAWVDLPRRVGADAGAPARVRADFAGTEHTWQARAVRIGGAIDEASRTVPVVVEVPRPYAETDERPPLVAGLFVAVDFHADPPPEAVTIPRRGLRPDDRVWVLDDEDRLRIRPVDVLRAGEDTAVIGSGLAPGDRLVTSNLQSVVEGMPLRPAAPDDDARQDDDARGGPSR